MEKKEYRRVIIGNVYPEIDGGNFPVKRAIGEKVAVEVDVFCDGRLDVDAELLYRRDDDDEWNKERMRPLGNDRWKGEFTVEDLGKYYYKIRGWIDRFRTWQGNLKRKFEAGQEIKADLLVGSQQIERAAERASSKDSERLEKIAKKLRGESEVKKAVTLALGEEVTSLMNVYPDKSSAETYGKELPVLVDRRKALFSSWYEMFPRSCGPESREYGTFKDCKKLLSKIAEMGFDVLYFPPYTSHREDE